jgi:hypothetical protein
MPSGSRGRSVDGHGGVVLVLILLGFLYAPTRSISDAGGTRTRTTHGFLVPLVSAYLVWERRGQLRSLTPRSSLSPPRQSVSRASAARRRHPDLQEHNGRRPEGGRTLLSARLKRMPSWASWTTPARSTGRWSSFNRSSQPPRGSWLRFLARVTDQRRIGSQPISASTN